MAIFLLWPHYQAGVLLFFSSSHFIFYPAIFVSRFDVWPHLHIYNFQLNFEQSDNHARRRTQPTQAETFQSSSHAQEAQGQGQEEEQQARGRSSFCLVNDEARYCSRAD